MIGTAGWNPAARRYAKMLRAVRRGWFSYRTEVLDDAGTTVAVIDLSNWRENARIEVSGRRYLARHETWSREFVLQREDGQVVAVAERPSAWRERFTLTHEGRRYELARESAWKGTFVLLREGAGVVGAVRQRGWFSSEVYVDLPEELPVEVRMLVLWLTIVLRRRQAAAASGSASG
jgi:hypothetical protein